MDEKLKWTALTGWKEREILILCYFYISHFKVLLSILKFIDLHNFFFLFRALQICSKRAIKCWRKALTLNSSWIACEVHRLTRTSSGRALSSCSTWRPSKFAKISNAVTFKWSWSWPSSSNLCCAMEFLKLPSYFAKYSTIQLFCEHFFLCNILCTTFITLYTFF